jgi:hypothetical protein
VCVGAKLVSVAWLNSILSTVTESSRDSCPEMLILTILILFEMLIFVPDKFMEILTVAFAYHVQTLRNHLVITLEWLS